MVPISKGQVVKKKKTYFILFYKQKNYPHGSEIFASPYKLFSSWKNGLCIIMLQTQRDFLYGQLVLFSSNFITLDGTGIESRTRMEQFSTQFKMLDNIYS